MTRLPTRATALLAVALAAPASWLVLPGTGLAQAAHAQQTTTAPAPATAAATGPARAAQDAPAADAARPLPLADYARWRSVAAPAISADGQWAAWAYTQLRRDDVLHVRHVDSGREHVVERASRPLFSADGRWVAYSVAPPFRDVEKLEAERKPVPRRAELMNLETGEKVGWDNVAAFEFAKTGSHLAVRRNRPEPRPKHDGVDVILRDLRTGQDELIAAVGAHAFNRAGTLLAWTVDAADELGNGLYLVELGTGVRRQLDNARARFSRMTWSEDGSALAVLRGSDADTLAQRPNTLLAFTGVQPGRAPSRVVLGADAAGLPASHVISDKAALSWNEGNNRLFFGIREQEVTVKPDPNAWQKASDVDVFHWNDDRIQSVQRRQAEQDRNRTDRAVLHLRGQGQQVVRLTDATLRGISITRDGRWGIATDDRAYVSDWEQARADIYRVDVANGTRTPVLEAHGRTLGLSPDGRRFLYWKDDHVWAYDLGADRHANLTARVPVRFVNTEWDYLSDAPPYGIAGYSGDGRGVVLNHRFDLWYVPFDGGSPRNLTNGLGGEHEIRFRYVQTDPEARFIDLSQPLLLSAFGEWTKRAGYYELRGGRMRELVYEDRYYSPVIKAAAADRYLFSRETWTEFPDLHVARGDFSAATRLTDANPQQGEYAWGSRILFDYTNSRGVRLQGTLAIPDGYQPGQRLPMIVSFYEKYSQNLHRYPRPSYAHRPDPAGYVSNGYLFMQPDVDFQGGSSHGDMLDAVEAAVRRVVELGYADPARVGLHGHSYSGGGASYIATRSNAFAAIVAGAAPINLVSEFNQLFRGTGQNNHQYDIYGQGRYGSNPYDDFERYWQQSPISGVTTMDTPLIYMHGDDDQIVEYLQGMEFYNALRFNRKPVIFLSYPGEGHGLTKLENQLDFQLRMLQFYGHNLKGEPAPSWLTEGERFIDKHRRQPVPINVEPVVRAAAAGGQE